MDLNLLIGAASLILAFIAVRYARQTFRKEHIYKRNEEVLHLQAQFKATQMLSNKVYMDLYTYVKNCNAFDQFMYPGITYSAYLERMKKSQEENLSDALFESLKSEQLSSTTIQSMCKSLENQFEALNSIHTEIKLKMSSTEK